MNQLVYNREDDAYQATVGDTRIQVKRDTFDKAMRVQIKEYMKGGMPELPDAYDLAKQRMLIAEYWISSTMDGVSITRNNETH